MNSTNACAAGFLTAMVATFMMDRVKRRCIHEKTVHNCSEEESIEIKRESPAHAGIKALHTPGIIHTSPRRQSLVAVATEERSATPIPSPICKPRQTPESPRSATPPSPLPLPTSRADLLDDCMRDLKLKLGSLQVVDRNYIVKRLDHELAAGKC